MAGKYTSVTILRVVLPGRGGVDYQVWTQGRNVRSKRLARFSRRSDAVAWIRSGKAKR